MAEIKCRAISKGTATGEVLLSSQAISFYGGVDPLTGVITEKGHPLEGKSISGKVLVFPNGKGSTVGSYALYRMKKHGSAPLAMVNRETDAIVAVGAIISGIPMVDKPESDVFTLLKDGQKVSVDGTEGKITTE